MWIFSKDGFLSAVEHRDNPDKVMIRFRNEGDAGRISTSLGTDYTKTPNADYMYRCVTDKQTFATYIAEQALDIDYDNFKNAVHDGTARDHAYMQVWSAMNSYQ